MEYLVYILAVIAGILLYLFLNLYGKYISLIRALGYIEKDFDLFNKLSIWEKQSKQNPFLKNIDPHDVYTTMHSAINEGVINLKKEKTKYGNTPQL